MQHYSSSWILSLPFDAAVMIRLMRRSRHYYSPVVGPVKGLALVQTLSDWADYVSSWPSWKMFSWKQQKPVTDRMTVVGLQWHLL
jgi:hypothetical protein